MDIKDIRNELVRLGYSDYYAKVILCLISSEKFLDAKEIERRTGVPLARLYSILISLEKERLVKSVSGNVKRYAASNKEDILNSISEKKKKELQKTREDIAGSLSFITKCFNDIHTEVTETEIRVFNDNEGYWKEYNSTVSKLKKGDVYRIINSKRAADSFLPEELENNPGIKEMIISDEKKLKEGVIIHLACNPESLVKNTFEELKGSEAKMEHSMKRLLDSYKRMSRYCHYISFTRWFKNIVIVIMQDSVFMEFYYDTTNVINTAIKIRSRQLSSDLSSWFDDFDSKKKHDPAKDYIMFEEEIKKNCLKIAKIDLNRKKRSR